LMRRRTATQAVIPNKSLAESNKSDSPVPSYSGGAPTFDCIWCSVSRSNRSRHSHRHRVRRSGRCQANLGRPLSSAGGGTTACGRALHEIRQALERGRSVIYRVFMTHEDYVVIDADSREEAMLKLRDAGLEPVKAEPFPTDAHARRSKGSAPAR